jgi:hypothetical protein
MAFKILAGARKLAGVISIQIPEYSLTPQGQNAVSNLV